MRDPRVAHVPREREGRCVTEATGRDGIRTGGACGGGKSQPKRDMSKRRPGPEEIESLRAQKRLNMERRGVHIQMVPGDAKTPAYGYTVGLWRGLGHPEVIMVGMAPETSQEILADVAEYAHRAPLRAGDRYGIFFDAYDVIFREVSPRNREWLKAANEHNAPDACPALQMVYPDRRGIFPWEPGFDPSVRSSQPMLG
jgi:hypothetical protein